MEFRKKINALSKSQTPFLCLISFDKKRSVVLPYSDFQKQTDILFQIGKRPPAQKLQGFNLKIQNPSRKNYERKYQKVIKEIQQGNSYLLNLTTKTELSPINLKQVYDQSFAKYKVYWKNHFVCFSPETFVRIENGFITSHPMKGTINATTLNAKKKLIESTKETAEHYTMVDFMRNDLGIVSDRIEVKRFKYIQKIRANHLSLFAMSSEICGKIKPELEGRLGDILDALLPAASVSGAPKKKVLEIIERIEADNRGFYTGIVGFFDGNVFESGVLIRFIEQAGEKFFYRSGGGITFFSDMKEEYQETQDKIYVPIC